MSRQRPRVQFTTAVFAALSNREIDADDLDTRMLDAAEHFLGSAGLQRWSIEDVADRAGVGRTSVYRRFGGRDDLVHAVLARELRRTFEAIRVAAEPVADLEGKAVAAVIAALDALNESVVDRLLRIDGATFLPFLTTEAGPLLAIARDALVALVSTVAAPPAPELAEAAARIGLSFVLTRESVLPIDDPGELADAVHRLVGPLFVAFGVTASPKRAPGADLPAAAQT